MSETIKISCYRTFGDKLPKAFCMLAEKCYHNNIKLFVYINTVKTMEELDKTLWTYSKKQFIPHATLLDTQQEKQMILLGNEFKNLNNASSLMMINASEKQILEVLSSDEDFNTKKCQRIFFLYDEDVEIKDSNIKDILSKSSIPSFKLDSYIQTTTENWKIVD